jgi:hypothetical protein
VQSVGQSFSARAMPVSLPRLRSRPSEEATKSECPLAAKVMRMRSVIGLLLSRAGAVALLDLVLACILQGNHPGRWLLNECTT